MEGSILAQNEAGGDGGGIGMAEGSKCTIVHVKFLNNTSASSGGGVQQDMGELKMNNCTLVGNHARSGGAIYLARGSHYIQNSIVQRNIAENSGGGIHIYRDGSLEIVSSILKRTSYERTQMVEAHCLQIMRIQDRGVFELMFVKLSLLKI